MVFTFEKIKEKKKMNELENSLLLDFICTTYHCKKFYTLEVNLTLMDP